MWMWFLQRWYEVPGWLVRVWLAGRAEARRGDASATEAPSRAAVTHAQAARSGRRALREMSLREIRQQVDKMRPMVCCKGEVLTHSGGIRSRVCSEDCEWSRLELLIANATATAEI